MKLFLVTFLLLSSVLNISIAVDLTGKESLIITSSPQPCQQPGCVRDEKGVRVQNIEKQYAWINNYKPAQMNFAGVVIPGNLTESGTEAQQIDMVQLLSTLKAPYFFGLGANDYIKNKDSCSDCAIRRVMWLGQHIEKVKAQTDNYKDNGKVYFDFIQAEVGVLDGSAHRNGIGSLGYTVELGAQKNIYLIQLNGNVDVGSEKFELESKNGVRRYHFKINPVVNWLENRLEYAAQYFYANPGVPHKTIVVSMNGGTVDPQIVALLNRYNVTLRFLSNNGSSPDCRKPGDMGDPTKFFCLGFSTEKEVLEVELDYDRHAFTVFNQKIAPDVRTKLHGAKFYDPVPELEKGKFYPQNKVVMFSHKGWYDYVAKVSYIDANKKEQIIADSGRKNANTIFMVDVPKEISTVTVSHAYMPGTVEVLNDTDRKNLTAPVICVATNGYSYNRSGKVEPKNSDIDINTSINFCDHPW